MTIRKEHGLIVYSHIKAKAQKKISLIRRKNKKKYLSLKQNISCGFSEELFLSDMLLKEKKTFECLVTWIWEITFLLFMTFKFIRSVI